MNEILIVRLITYCCIIAKSERDVHEANAQTGWETAMAWEGLYTKNKGLQKVGRCCFNDRVLGVNFDIFM